MAIGERFTSGGAHGIARFLAEHQRCNAGYDVRRDDQFGSGKLSITCGGCGASVEYRAAEAGELAAGGHQAAPLPPNGGAAYTEPPPPVAPSAPPLVAPPPVAAPAPIAPQPADPPPPTGPPPRSAPTSARPTGMPSLPGVRRKPERGRSVVPSWVSVALISALILGGLTMIAIGLTKDDEEPATTPQAGQTPAQKKPSRGQNQQRPAAGQPAPGQKNNKQKNKQNKQQAQGTGAQGQAPAAPVVPAAPVAPATGDSGAVALTRRTFAKRFAIGVPAGWDTGRKEGAIALTAPGATAEILVFFQRGETPLPELARGARGFLKERHKGAQIGAPQPVRVGSQRGLRVVATYQGGAEAAVVISAKGYSYVILRRVDRGASPDLAQQADAALASFSPK